MADSPIDIVYDMAKPNIFVANLLKVNSLQGNAIIAIIAIRTALY
jgi:hypothetical protein